MAAPLRRWTHAYAPADAAAAPPSARLLPLTTPGAGAAEVGEVRAPPLASTRHAPTASRPPPRLLRCGPLQLLFRSERPLPLFHGRGNRKKRRGPSPRPLHCGHSSAVFCGGLGRSSADACCCPAQISVVLPAAPLPSLPAFVSRFPFRMFMCCLPTPERPAAVPGDRHYTGSLTSPH